MTSRPQQRTQPGAISTNGSSDVVGAAGSDLCTECPEEQLSYSAHETCLACITNTSCPIGPNGETCSGVGDCYLGVCDCK